MSMNYIFLLQNYCLYRKDNEKKSKNTHIKIKLINFNRSYD